MFRGVIYKNTSIVVSAASLLFVFLSGIPLMADGHAEGKAEDGVKVVKNAQKCHQPVQLGISVTMPTKSIRAQLPMLPRGSGFILDRVLEGGSAQAAGLTSMDVIWKLDDQILINEGQLAVLLGMYQVGETAKIHYFRSGESKSVDVLLTASAEVDNTQASNQIELPFLNPPNLGVRVISYEDESATISDDNGTATLSYVDKKPWLIIESKDGVEVFNSQVLSAEEKALIPAPWDTRLMTLQHSLEQSVGMRRLPRVRRVPVRRRPVTKE